MRVTKWILKNIKIVINKAKESANNKAKESAKYKRKGEFQNEKNDNL